MLRKDLDIVLKHSDYKNGGTKKACVLVREFLNHIKINSNQISSPDSSVSPEEFIQAVSTLLAFSCDKSDTIPEKWHCDVDCIHSMSLFCDGECNLDSSSSKLCPFFTDESFK